MTSATLGVPATRDFIWHPSFNSCFHKIVARLGIDFPRILIRVHYGEMKISSRYFDQTRSIL